MSENAIYATNTCVNEIEADTRKRIAYRYVGLREKPQQYAAKADIEERQRVVFEWIVRMLADKVSNKTSCYVALMTTVPKKGLLGCLGGKRTREHFDITQADGIPINYWADVLILPVADTSSGHSERQGRTLVVPILTVRRRYWLWGDLEVVMNDDWYDGLMRDLPMMTEYANEIDRSTFMAASFAQKSIVEKCVC